MPKLTFILEDGQEIIVPLTDRITIGSTDQNDVFVDDERVSRQHAELLMNADGSVQVFDLKSSAGTFVNGHRVVSHTLLHGDKLSFGPLQAVLDLELPPPPAPAAKTRRIPVGAPAPAASAIPSEDLRAAENRLALLEAAAKQAQARQQEWLAAIERLRIEHEEKSASLTKLTSQHEEKAAALAAAERQLENVSTSLRAEEDKLAAVRREHEELAARTQSSQQQLREAEQQWERMRSQIAELAPMEQKLASLETSIVEAEKRQKAHETAIDGLQQERTHQEEALIKVETSLAEAQAALTACREDLASGKKQVEELRDRRAEFEAANNAPLHDLHHRIEKAQGDLATLEARLRPLRDWKEAQDRRLAQLGLLPPHSPEARELLREIDSEAADLLQIVNIPPSRTPRVVQVEPPYFKGVPLKSGHIRVQMGSVSGGGA
jgi:pSer/pThr/pTyr-binding forkhead associated (FHA) protein/predicted  nucleic acid-binding Zn-ribbon protein